MSEARQADLDVLVIGGGNAALNAAITARHAGRSVLVLESAPEVFRGGNSRHTRDIRYVHDEASRYVTGPYSEEEFWDDLLRVTHGMTNEHLARLTIRESADICRLGDRRTASAGSYRCGGRSTWPGRTSSCSAAARR